MSNSLTPRESELLGKFMLAGKNKDVPIDDLHAAMFDDADNRDGKTPQQRLGAIISKVNRKLDGTEIVPGQLKRTYRFQDKRK